jgi:hypothetical protein
MNGILEIDRYVHWVHLINLQPNETYFFIAGYGDDIQLYTSERKFRTIPSGESKLHFVAGGDSGTSEVAKKVGILSLSNLAFRSMHLLLQQNHNLFYLAVI